MGARTGTGRVGTQPARQTQAGIVALPEQFRAAQAGQWGVPEVPVDPWQRPADWVTLPSIGDSDQKMVGLMAVFDDDSNYRALSATTSTGTYHVDWGDGSSNDYTSGVSAEHLYDYSDGDLDGTLSSRGYKQAVVTVTANTGNLTGVDLNVKHSRSGLVTGYEAGWLDVAVAGQYLTSLTVGSSSLNVTCGMLEQFKLYTSAVTNMSYMFYSCYSLVSVPLLDTSAVTNMSNMFYSCYSLVSVPLLDTSAVTNMSYMFRYCYSLVSVPLLDTSAVTNMSYMFYYCYSLVSVPLLDTSAVTNMSSMFRYCYSLVSVPLLDTSAVTSMSYMFYSCYSLVSVPLLDTSAVTDMSNMFYYCYSLVSVPLLDTSAVTDMSSMFRYCYSLVSVPLLDTSAVTDMSSMFYYCYSLVSVAALNVSAVTSGHLDSTFYACRSLSSAPLSGAVYTHSFSGCRLARAEIVDIFNGLGSASSQTITVSGNHGYADLTGADLAIATGKGWTVA